MSVTLNSERIATLIPELQEKAKEFLEKAAAVGIPCLITQGRRTWEQQDELYAQGRTKPGKIVTNAKGGYSWHNFGRAFDVVPLKNGNAWWGAPSSVWKRLGEIGTSLGLGWGGAWERFKDLPHFELTGGKTLAEARAEEGR